MSSSDELIRSATPGDAEQIAEIYNHYVLTSTISGTHAVIGGVALPNEASLRLHQKFGFEKVAHFKEVGFKFDRWIDVTYWQLIL
jgi:L-amino acid N-acyltransferase YncA